jgi:hypothetical protein
MPWDTIAANLKVSLVVSFGGSPLDSSRDANWLSPAGFCRNAVAAGVG